MKTPRTVVVGAGGISNAWFPPLQKEGVEICAIVDVRRQVAEEQVGKYNLHAEVSENLQAMLKKHSPDFVVDLTVPEAHEEVTCTALRAGCHVIGEKPMATSMEAARRMVSTAEETDRLYMVSQSRRWNANHAAARQAIRQGRVGKLTTANCDFYIGAHFEGFRTDMPSPLILDMAIHHFDLARMITGKDPLAVYAHEFNPAGSWYDGDAAASCIFEMTDGVVFTYRGSWCCEGAITSWNGDWRFLGDLGDVTLAGDNHPQARVVEEGDGLVRTLRPESIPTMEVPCPTMHGALREMLRYLRTGELPQTHCRDNIKSLAMVFAAMESSRKQQRVAIGV